MDITFRTSGAWGGGKGANLQASEVDNNFWSLVQAVLDLQENPSQANGIASITVSGTQMTIYLNDGTALGPYTLPVLVFHWRGEMQPGTYYYTLDVFTVVNVGIFLVQIDHLLDVFDPDLVIGGQPVYLQLFGSVDASLSSLSDVAITTLLDNDFLSWQTASAKWVNRQLGTMAVQNAFAVDILGGSITGLVTPVNPSDAATKAYVDALPGGATAPDATMMSNIASTVAPAIPNTLSDFLDHVLGTSIRGTILFRGAPGWIALPPGDPGKFLQSLGPGFDLTWALGISGVTQILAGTGIDTSPDSIISTGSIALAAIADNRIMANVSGTSAPPTPVTIGELLDHILGTSRGTILTRTIGGWVTLAPGLTGQYLKTQGSGADLLWDSPAGTGTVISVSAGTGITTGGSPITSAGTVSLAAIATNSVLANISGGSAAPVPATVSVLFDAVFGATQGGLLYRSATAWSRLAPGTSGQVLTTGGGSANPAWANAAAGAPIANLLLLANISGATAAASGNTLSNILDAAIGSSRGMLVYRGLSGWTTLAPGTTGQLLQTGGAAGDPSWVTGATGGASITTSDTPPASPADGDAWWDSVGGQLYIRYDDGNSQQWVPATNSQGPAGAPGATGATGATGPTGPAGAANMTGMTAGQIPIAASATSVASSANLSGDVTSNAGLVATLATVNANVGTFQGLTVNGKGLVTAASNQGYATSSAMTTADNLRVLKAGDTMTGGLAIQPASGDASLALTKSGSTSSNSITGYSGASGARWQLNWGDATAESGANAGSDFTLSRFADGGTYLGNPLTINRATGDASFSGKVATIGIQARAGLAGPYAGNWFNINWTGAVTQLYIDSTNLGQITTTCDYRIKDNVTDLPSTWDRVKALRPISYTIKENVELLTKASDEEHWGFIAHELQETLLLSAATGYKDAPDLVQSPDLMALIAPLTKALQEAMARIEALEAEPAP